MQINPAPTKNHQTDNCGRWWSEWVCCHAGKVAARSAWSEECKICWARGWQHKNDHAMATQIVSRHGVANFRGGNTNLFWAMKLGVKLATISRQLLVVVLRPKQLPRQIHTTCHATRLDHLLSPKRSLPRQLHATPKVCHANFTPPFPLLISELTGREVMQPWHAHIGHNGCRKGSSFNAATHPHMNKGLSTPWYIMM